MAHNLDGDRMGVVLRELLDDGSIVTLDAHAPDRNQLVTAFEPSKIQAVRSHAIDEHQRHAGAVLNAPKHDAKRGRETLFVFGALEHNMHSIRKDAATTVGGGASRPREALQAERRRNSAIAAAAGAVAVAVAFAAAVAAQVTLGNECEVRQSAAAVERRFVANQRGCLIEERSCLIEQRRRTRTRV